VRKIEAELVSYIDSKLIHNGSAVEAIAKKDARAIFGYAAEALVGIREATNSNDGPMVKLLQETVGSANGEAWCMSFVMSCLAYAELRSERQSRLPATEHCLTLWQSSPLSLRVHYRPLKGAIAIWQHGETTNGHTGVFIEARGLEFTAVEGNTSSGLKADGSIEREGGGSYRTSRNFKGNGSMKLRGFLKPF
jgi:hypothetical protein